MSKNQFCERCTQELRGIEVELCTSCEMLVGDKPTEDAKICEFCGDQWIFGSHYMCLECFKVEPCFGVEQ